jgi:hypothetical protein
MTILRRIIALGSFIFCLVVGWNFATRNGGMVRVDLLLGVVEDAKVWLVLLVSAAFGATLVALVCATLLLRAGLVARRYRKAITELETEVHQLRNLPLAVEDLTRSAGTSVPAAGSGLEPASGIPRSIA